MHDLGEAYRSAGRFKEAIDSFEVALAGRIKRIGSDHPNTVMTLAMLGETYRQAGQPEKAVSALQSAAAKFKALLGTENNETRIAEDNLSLAYLDSRQPLQAIPLLESRVKRLRARSYLDVEDLISNLRRLANAYVDTKQHSKALAILEDALQISTRPPLAPNRETIRILYKIALLRTPSRPDHAIEICKEAIALSVHIFGPNDAETFVATSNLAETWITLGRQAEAIAIWEELLPKINKHAPEHDVWEHTVRKLAWWNLNKGDHDKAISQFEQILTFQKKKSPNSPMTLVAMHNLGNAYRVAKKLDKAIPLLEEANSTAERHAPVGHEVRRAIPRTLARAYVAAKKLDNAMPLFEISFERFKSDRGQTAPETLEVLNDLARLYEITECWEKLEPVSLALMAYYESKLPKEHTLVLNSYTVVGLCQLRMKKYEDADKILRISLRILDNSKPNVIPTFHNRVLLGEALLGQKKYDYAEPFLKDGYEGLKKLEKSIPPEGRRIVLEEALDALIRLAEAQEKPEEVKKLKAEKALLPPNTIPKSKE